MALITLGDKGAHFHDARQTVHVPMISAGPVLETTGTGDASPSTAVRLAAGFRDKGSIAPKAQGRAPGTAGKLAPHVLFLVGIVTAEPDITLRELSGALVETHGLRVDLSSIHRALDRADLSYKKRPDRAGTATRRLGSGPVGLADAPPAAHGTGATPPCVH